MGVDTKGVVATGHKDVFDVVLRVEKALKAAMRPLQNGEPIFRCHDQFTHPHTEVSAESQLVRVMFKWRGEDRMLWIFFGCDCDHLELAQGPSLSLMLGYWGSSEELMKIALHALSDLGPVWFKAQDFDGAYERLSVPAEAPAY